MKKYLLLCLLLLISITLTGCGEKTGVAFKKDYESVNGKENAHGKIHRTIEIDENNPFIEVKSDEIVKMIENGETFYVYFGSTLCPWCRSTIEKAIEVALNKGISKIYYVDIWDDEGNEIVRDKYVLDDNNKPVLSIKGDANYSKLLTYFNDFLSDYTLTDAKGNKIMIGEKRIYAPNYMYIQNGNIKKLVTGISDKQTDSRGELTKEILADEENDFNNFFTEACADGC